MDPVREFIANYNSDPKDAVLALFVAFGYYMSSDRETIEKIITYANEEYEKNV